MIKKLSLLLLLLVCIASVQAEQVRYVIDGDTFILADGSRVRLGGIDAPELNQPYGKEARNYLETLVAHREVTLRCNGEMSYNRQICKASVVGLDIQKELVGWGLAFDYTHYSGGAYQAAEQFAYHMKRGVWSGGLRPWDYRKIERDAYR